MNYETLIGTRLFNRGDVANLEHWGVVTQVKPGGDIFEDRIQVTPEDPELGIDPYWIYPAMISETDKGHGGTRIVTEAAYRERRQKVIKLMQEDIKRLKKACKI